MCHKDGCVSRLKKEDFFVHWVGYSLVALTLDLLGTMVALESL